LLRNYGYPNTAYIVYNNYKDYTTLKTIADNIKTCKDYINAVTKPSLVFINGKLTTINHDLDMCDMLDIKINCIKEEKQIWEMYK
jgi:hypothetical protein